MSSTKVRLEKNDAPTIARASPRASGSCIGQRAATAGASAAGGFTSGAGASSTTAASVGGVSSNSLVGTHLFAATLRQLGRRDVELVYADQDWSQAAHQLCRAIARAAGTARIKTAKIGLIGHQAPGFVDLHPDPFALHKTFQGCVLEHVGLADLSLIHI